jgi:hypothetical protein
MILPKVMKTRLLVAPFFFLGQCKRCPMSGALRLRLLTDRVPYFNRLAFRILEMIQVHFSMLCPIFHFKLQIKANRESHQTDENFVQKCWDTNANASAPHPVEAVMT